MHDNKFEKMTNNGIVGKHLYGIFETLIGNVMSTMYRKTKIMHVSLNKRKKMNIWLPTYKFKEHSL